MKKLVKIIISCIALISINSYAQAPKVLNLGILGGHNATEQIGDNLCVKDFLDKELGVDTKLRNATDYQTIIEGFLSGKIDAVVGFSPAAFASIYLRDPNAVEIVGIQANDETGVKGYYSVAIVKKDSPYKKLEDLKDTTFAFADPNSSSGYLVPDNAFKSTLGGNYDNSYNNFFKNVTFSGGHEQNIIGVLNGQFDAAVTWTSMEGDRAAGYNVGALNRLVKNGYPDLMDKIRVIWVSPFISDGPCFVSNYLDKDFKVKLIAALKKLDKEHHKCFTKASAGDVHLVPATIDDFKMAIELKRAAMQERR